MGDTENCRCLYGFGSMWGKQLGWRVVAVALTCTRGDGVAFREEQCVLGSKAGEENPGSRRYGGPVRPAVYEK
ncbi:hypothetical protein EYF80_022389 [Liparis tanakae]|uniref:Uncharacterized protein n=1 Tax=Liparis tanakae TaxID=230148 RepID=A0A4Z2HR11_9TELE|nr:hypothetical protein EYF80_022389 [Liparis tanakae]